MKNSKENPKFILKYYSDSGHGWYSIKLKTLSDFCLLPKISSYSYMRGLTVYLEEDCDAGIVINAIKDKGYTVAVEQGSYMEKHIIRSYDRYDWKVAEIKSRML